MIYILYLSKCIVSVSKDENFVEYYKGKFNLLFVSDKIILKDKSILILNPLLLFSPIFAVNIKKKNRNRKFIKKNRLTISILNKLIPIIFILSIIEFIIFPFSLIYQHMGLIILSIFSLYISLFILIIQIWVFKNKLGLSSKQFRAISLEYILCPPFALNGIRNISILKLQEEGKVK